MGRAHVGVSIPIQFASWNVATDTHKFGRDLLLALGALVLLVNVALEDVLSLKLHGALRALPRLLVSMHVPHVVGELKVLLEFDLADLARNLVGLAWGGVEVLVVRSPLLEDLPTISAHQGAGLSMCFHLRGAWECHITKGAFARFRICVRDGCHGSVYKKAGIKNGYADEIIPTNHLFDECQAMRS